MDHPSEATAVVLVHRDGRYLRANERFRSYTGFDLDGDVPFRIGDLSASPQPPAEQIGWARVVADPERAAVGRLHRLRRRDGSDLWADVVSIGRTDDPDVFEIRWRPMPTTERARSNLSVILAEWRRAERALADPATEEDVRPALRARIADLRALYQTEAGQLVATDGRDGRRSVRGAGDGA